MRDTLILITSRRDVHLNLATINVVRLDEVEVSGVVVDLPDAVLVVLAVEPGLVPGNVIVVAAVCGDHLNLAGFSVTRLDEVDLAVTIGDGTVIGCSRDEYARVVALDRPVVARVIGSVKLEGTAIAVFGLEEVEVAVANRPDSVVGILLVVPGCGMQVPLLIAAALGETMDFDGTAIGVVDLDKIDVAIVD